LSESTSVASGRRTIDAWFAGRMQLVARQRADGPTFRRVGLSMRGAASREMSVTPLNAASAG
jgi:hypothetical protein